MGIKVFLTVFGMVFLAELGDKTQLATFLMATDNATSKWVVFAGAAFALVLSSFLAVILGDAVSRWISPKVLKIAAGVVFVVIGAITVYNGTHTPSAAPETIHTHTK